MALDKDMNSLDPRIKPIFEYLIKVYKLITKKELKVIETRRNQAVQTAYFAQGRKSLGEVNKLRDLAGLYHLTEEQNKNKITNVEVLDFDKSHAHGLAMDVMPEDGYNADMMYWNKIGEAVQRTRELFANRLNELDAVLVWGGTWKMRDLPHIEVVFNTKKGVV